MLTGISVRNIILIERLDLAFDGGLIVLTGETGAGKSILLDALGLSVGARADAGLVRNDAHQAMVTAIFDVAPGHAARTILAESEIDDQEDALILRRTLGSDGRSRAYVNDRPVSVATLRRLGESLLEVHGQFDGRGLMDRATHRDSLDVFGGLSGLRDEVSTAHGIWQQAATRLQSAERDAESLDRQIAELREAVETLGALAPEPDEESALTERRQMLMHAEQLVEAVDGAIAELDGEGMASGHLRAAQRHLEKVVEKAGGGLDGAMAALERAQVEAVEALHELQVAAADIEGGGAELPVVEERLYALRDAARKYGAEPVELPARLEAYRARLDELSGDADPLSAARAAAAATRETYIGAAQKLTTGRTEAARRLSATVGAELPPLRMEKAVFETAVEPLAESEWSDSGCDLVEFRIATNPGSVPGPLTRIASGGELARFMLALKIALVGVGTAETLIFDEVDAGVGGATADAVGERLERLGAEKQVLVVTHSPQVAARGDDHLRVEKQSDTEAVATVVSRLNADARREEVARMLSGQSVTDEARGAAERLIRRESA